MLMYLECCFPCSFMQDVLDRTHLSSEVFNLYLHQNYLEFFVDIDDVVS